MKLRRHRHHGLRNMLGAGTLIAGAALLYMMGPDLIRYLRIKSM